MLPHAPVRPLPTTALCLATLLVGAAPAAAQTAASPTAPVRPGDERPSLPRFGDDRAPLALPPPPPASRPPAIGAGPLFRLAGVRLLGSTVLSEAEVRRTAAPYLGSAVGAAELDGLRRALTGLYVQRGYVNSGVTLPDQTVADGIVTLQAVEGRLDTVTVNGLSRLDPAYVARRLEPAAGPPLDVASLRDRIEVLLQDPLVERLDARLGPGARPGGGALDMTVEEAPLLGGTLTLSNERSPAVGGLLARGDGVIRNATGWGEVTSLRLARSRGLTNGAAAVEVPVSAGDTRLRLSVDHQRSRIVEAPYSALDITARTTSVEAGVTQPLYRTGRETVSVGVSLGRRFSENWLLRERFAFSPESDDGITRFTVLRLSQDWTRRGDTTVWAARSVWSLGVPLFGNTRRPGTPDGRFSAWLGQAQVAHRFGDTTGDGGAEAIFRTDAQFANGPLPAIEQYAVGGMASVRGYRENLLTADNAVVSSVEVRLPVAHLALDSAAAGTVRLALFADYGRSFNSGRASTGPGWIASAGTGVLWAPTGWAQTALYYGHGFRRVEVPGRRDMQDRGVHVRLTLTPPSSL